MCLIARVLQITNQIVYLYWIILPFKLKLLEFQIYNRVESPSTRVFVWFSHVFFWDKKYIKPNEPKANTRIKRGAATPERVLNDKTEKEKNA